MPNRNERWWWLDDQLHWTTVPFVVWTDVFGQFLASERSYADRRAIFFFLVSSAAPLLLGACVVTAIYILANNHYTRARPQVEMNTPITKRESNIPSVLQGTHTQIMLLKNLPAISSWVSFPS